MSIAQETHSVASSDEVQGTVRFRMLVSVSEWMVLRGVWLHLWTLLWQVIGLVGSCLVSNYVVGYSGFWRLGFLVVAMGGLTHWNYYVHRRAMEGIDTSLSVASAWRPATLRERLEQRKPIVIWSLGTCLCVPVLTLPSNEAAAYVAVGLLRKSPSRLSGALGLVTTDHFLPQVRPQLARASIPGAEFVVEIQPGSEPDPGAVPVLVKRTTSST